MKLDRQTACMIQVYVFAICALLCLGGYYANFIKLMAMPKTEQTESQVNLRIIGIPLIPLGVIMGYVPVGE